MKNKNQVIEYLEEHDGLPKGMTWSEVARMFNVEPLDKERAKVDKYYAEHSPGEVVRAVWRRYKKRYRKGLELVKETYKEDKLLYSTYKKQPQDDDVDKSSFEIEGFTENPYGGKWIRYKKNFVKITDEFVQKIADKLSGITPMKEPERLATSGFSVLLYGADKHIGAKTMENSLYDNKWDKEAMRKRLLERPLAELNRLQKIYGRLKRVIVFDLGDALDGFNGKTTRGNNGKSSHSLPQRMTNTEQFEFYLELHKEFFDRLFNMNITNEIRFYATSNSNHGGDFEYMAMRALEQYLNLKYPFIKTDVTNRFINHVIIGKHAIIYSHGNDSEDRKYGMPINLDTKSENFISEYIDLYKLNDYYNTFVSGDMHTYSLNFSRKFRYLKVMSQYAASKWIQTNFHGSVAGMNYDIIRDNEYFVQTGSIIYEDAIKPRF